jgi:hypothetical protein
MSAYSSLKGMRRREWRRLNVSGAKEAAEKLVISGEEGEEHPTGAKARLILLGLVGTTKVVPCYKASKTSFSEACKARRFC